MLAFTTAPAAPARLRKVAVRDVRRVLQGIAKAKQRLGLPANAAQGLVCVTKEEEAGSVSSLLLSPLDPSSLCLLCALCGEVSSSSPPEDLLRSQRKV
jgi:hypothetical protein